MIRIDDTSCGCCGAVKRLRYTITWVETMEIRAANGDDIVAGPTMDLRPPICDPCREDAAPKTAQPR